MKLNYKKTILVGFAFFLILAFWQAYDTVVPLMLVNKFGLNQTWSGVIMALDNLIALVMLPLFGSLSDKTKSKYGRRTPYIFIGTLVAVVCFMGLSFADNYQLSKINEVVNPETAYQTLWEEDLQVSNAEYNTINNKDVPKKYSLKDYACLIVNNKNYADSTEQEKNQAYSWFKDINKDYGKGKDGYETYYFYDSKTNLYSTVTVVEENGGVVYLQDSTGEKLRSTDVINAYSTIVTNGRSAYAWNKTVSNPMPLVLFVITLLLVLISMSVFRSPAVALMPDVTVKPLRSQANAIINLMGTAGGMLVLVVGMIFATGKSYNQSMSYVGYISVVCAIMLVGLAVFLTKVKEVKWSQEMLQDTVKYGISEEEEDDKEKRKLSKKEVASFIFILASVALWYMGYNAVTSKYSLYAISVLHMDYNTTLLIAQAAAIISYVPVGLIASKVGRKKSILAGVIMLAVAFIGATFMNSASSPLLMNLLFIIAGIGWATINVNSFPMVVELAKGGDTGKYTGYYYTASMTAQVVTPVLSGWVMDIIGSMKPLFYYASIFVILSFVTMLFVKHGDNRPQPKKSVIENFNVED